VRQGPIEVPAPLGVDWKSLTPQELLQLVARLLAPFDLPVEPAELLLEAGDDAAVTLVEEVKDLESPAASPRGWIGS